MHFVNYARPMDLADITEAWVTLQRFHIKDAGPRRMFDGKTPLAVHSLLAACLLASESDVPERIRWLGQQVLLRHDTVEDTRAGLPTDASPELRELVEGMTFPGGSREEMAEVWKRPPLIWFFKLYDKWANCADGANPGGWMESRGAEYRARYVRFLHDLLKGVEERKAEIFPERPNAVLLISGMIRGCFPVF